ncbi:LPXTG cell wall anchor domain-containing protein [Staphylococcus saprophyticus]|nr:LPXTG cell wall anchor domain-containing protein [Staphylococcus saprophyticus]MDW4006754.1 LPXTG cell wall anchor domain-containing protein [Staphylococcus saprophyticus]MDW4219804.1 LPXTG cell wall anchor domain-containing protein [Staphylococcus saprophyticus]MDW4338214.1 LPXTG cell wall anchor domain-containing protein [Staphylococcus saprophyticus]
MKKIIFPLSAGLLSGALLLGNDVADAAINEDKLKSDAVDKVSEEFGYVENGLKATGQVEDKGQYYEVPAVQSTGVGGLQIIKVDKETGNLQFGDNDTKNFQASGSLNIDTYNTDENSTKDKNNSEAETKNQPEMLPETGGENDFNNILFGILSLILGISFLAIKKLRNNV